MNSNLTSAYAAVILMAALAAALPFHLSRILGPQRLLHAAYAVAALGLFCLLGATAFGWTFDRQGALLWVYLALFLLAAGIAARRRMMFGAIGLPWLSALIQLGVVAYMFAPDSFRKPPVTAALFLYFLFEALVWLRGREAQEPAESLGASDRARPPLFPPRRHRGFAEASLAAAAIAIAFLLVVGPASGAYRSGVGFGAARAANRRNCGERRDDEQRGIRFRGRSIRDRRSAEDREPGKRAGGRRASRGPCARRAPGDRGEGPGNLYGARGRYV